MTAAHGVSLGLEFVKRRGGGVLTFSWRSCSSVFSVTLLGVFGYLWRRSGDYLIVFFLSFFF